MVVAAKVARSVGRHMLIANLKDGSFRWSVCWVRLAFQVFDNEVVQ